MELYSHKVIGKPTLYAGDCLQFTDDIVSSARKITVRRNYCNNMAFHPTFKQRVMNSGEIDFIAGLPV